jgi:hypothetical protein
VSGISMRQLRVDNFPRQSWPHGCSRDIHDATATLSWARGTVAIGCRSEIVLDRLGRRCRRGGWWLIPTGPTICGVAQEVIEAITHTLPWGSDRSRVSIVCSTDRQTIRESPTFPSAHFSPLPYSFEAGFPTRLSSCPFRRTTFNAVNGRFPTKEVCPSTCCSVSRGMPLTRRRTAPMWRTGSHGRVDRACARDGAWSP